MRRLCVCLVSVIAVTSVFSAQTDFVIDSFRGNGDLSWSNYPGALEYRVEWSSNLQSPEWTNSWDGLNGIPATGRYYTARVPMFYRLIAVMPDYTRLLLHCDGTNADTNFPDETGRHDIQVVGNIEVSTAQSRFGGASAFFKGSLDNWLTIADSPDFDPGLQPFTIDFWMYPTNQNITGQYLLGKSYADSGRGYDIRYHLNSVRVVGVNGWAENIISPPIVTNGAWYHIAVVCQTNQTALFINGTNQGTAGRIYFADTTEAFHIGDSPGFGGSAFHGFLDEIRYSLGSVRWTNDFVVPSAPWADD